MLSRARNLANLLGGGEVTVPATKIADIPASKLSDEISTIEQVSDIDALTATGNTVGDQRVVGNNLYIWNGSGWFRIALINETPTWDSGGQPLSVYVLDRDSPQDATIITLAASDPDGFPISYSYVTGGSMDSMATISQDSSVFTITPKTLAQVGEGVELTGSITFRASDGINILPQVSSFTLSFIFRIENSKYTTLLATATGTSDNNDITDSSTNNYTISVNQSTNVSAGTFSPYRHGGYSTYFDGNGDYLQTQNAYSSVGTGDFTAEAWIWIDSGYSEPTPFVFASNPNGFNFGISRVGASPSTNYVLNVGHSYVGNLYTGSTTTMVPSQWYHIAVSRSSGTMYCFVDGQLEGSLSDSSNFNGTINYIGAIPALSDYDWKGYIADARFVTSAVYTSNFTPPIERLTAIANTSLLTCHLPYIADGSSNGQSITVNGNTSTKPFGPYDNLKYTAADHGGSVSMPNDNDYLYVPHSSTLKPSGTDPFCVSFWYYPTTSPGTTRQLVGDAAYVSYPTNCPGWDILYQSGSQLDVRWGYPNYADMASGKTNSTVQVNAWNHIVLCRSGGSLSYYLNGKRCNTTTSNINISASGAANFYVGYAGEATGTAVNTAMGTIADFKYEVGTSQFDATASTITVPTAPQSTTNSVLHIKGTDASIIDKSQTYNLKLVGNTVASTTQAKFSNTASVYFDGDADEIEYTVPTLSGDFTFEAFIYPEDQPQSFPNCFTPVSDATANNRIVLSYDISTAVDKFRLRVGSNFIIPSGTNSSGQWYHVAVVRSGSSVSLYIDGILIGTETYSGSISSRTGNIGDAFKGYIQDFRVTNGLARYTANFTPPSSPLEG